MKSTDVLIIGGGASGIMAALSAAEMNADVTIVEHNDMLGRKILSTGNGKCNYTNMNMGSKYYRGSNPLFTESALKQFGAKDTIEYFKKLGIYPKEKNGYMYPYSEQASAFVTVLTDAVRNCGIHVYLNENISDIREDDGFIVTLSKKEIKARKLIFATGLLAGRKSGCDGSSFQYIEKFGHTFIDIVPALVHLKSEASFLRMLAGIRAEIKLKLYENETEVFKDRGEALFLENGLSGIVTFQGSRFVSYALKAGHKVTAVLDLAPDIEKKEIIERFQGDNEYKSATSALIGLLSDKLSECIIDLLNIDPEITAGSLRLSDIERIAETVKNFKLTITGTRSFEDAQVAAGGVNTDEINEDTMESKLIPGVYFAGELIDIDGMCGGYNLQWAWSSGRVAGINAARNCND
ncbi:MAG: NAD(P)/FAD-dependent oxidoreductase [Lachnospiraceae bacterium]|nr:NAD(P)/FAD-dependent oxidoreductase [Lachnospiraceae bacterium]